MAETMPIPNRKSFGGAKRRGRCGDGTREEVVLDQPELIESDPLARGSGLTHTFGRNRGAKDQTNRWSLHRHVRDPSVVNVSITETPRAFSAFRQWTRESFVTMITPTTPALSIVRCL